MKTFEIYMIEENFLRAYNLKRNELICEFLGFDIAPSQGPSYSRQFASRKNKNPRKVFISDDDTLFDKFIQSAVKKIGTLAVAGALLFLKFSYKTISYILRFAGKLIFKILKYLGLLSINVLNNLYISLKDYLKTSNDFTNEEKQIIEEKLNQNH